MTDQHRIDHAKAIADGWINAYFGRTCSAEEAGANIAQTMRTFRTSHADTAESAVSETAKRFAASNVQPHPATQQTATK